MDSASGVNFNPQQAMQSLVEQKVSFQVKFGDKGEITLSVLKEAQPTEGLKSPERQVDGASVPRKLPLSGRRVSKLTVGALPTVREAVSKGVKFAKAQLQRKLPVATDRVEKFSSKAMQLAVDIKDRIVKAVKHENWEKIPKETVSDGSEQLKKEVQLHNDSIDQLQEIDGQKREIKKELSDIKKEYRNTLELLSDPQIFIDSKKSITIPIPIEGHDPVVIKSATPQVREQQVNDAINLIKESALLSSMDHLEREVDRLRSEANELKKNMKGRSDEILEMYGEVHDKHLEEGHQGSKFRLERMDAAAKLEAIKSGVSEQETVRDEKEFEKLLARENKLSDKRVNAEREALKRQLGKKLL